MRIVCPACNAAYQVPDDQLSEGRVVRCVRCGTDWAPIEPIPAAESEREKATAPAVAEALEQVPAPEPEPLFEKRRMAIEEDIPLPRPTVLPKPPPAKGGSALLVIAWLLSLALIGGAIAILYVGRERVMAVWPPSVRAYAALGLAGHPVASERRE